MMTKCVMFFVLSVVAHASAGAIPLATYAVAPVASSYSAHTVNHAIATPVVSAAPLVAAPLVAAHAPLVAAHAAPLVAAHSPLVAAHAPLVAAHAPLAAYSAYPYSAYPYSAYPYASYLG